MDAAFPPSNGTLSALGSEDWEALSPHLRRARLDQGVVLSRIGEPSSTIYFPESGAISLVVEFSQGQQIEVATMGREGMFGAGAVANPVSASTAIVMFPVVASAIDVAHFRPVVQRSAVLQAILHRQDNALFMQAQQTAACNAVHPIERRVARWLLRVRDVTDSNKFFLTQEQMAQMLGANHNSISIAAHLLQESNLIRFSRGHLEITDPDGLAGVACECYAALKAHEQMLKAHLSV